MMWQIQVYNRETKEWRNYGSPSSYYEFACVGVRKLQEIGYKVRLKKIITG